MRKIVTVFLLLVVATTLAAKDHGKVNYYAIDGSTWTTCAERDTKEELLWKQVEIDLAAALANGRLGEATGQQYHDMFKKLFQQCKLAFVSIRQADTGRDALQNAEFRFFLSQNGIRARLGTARNGETFNYEEYGNCFNSVLREYSFNAKLIASLANPTGGNYNLEFVLTDFTERMEIVLANIDQEKRKIEHKEISIKQLVPKYKQMSRRGK